MDRYSRLIAVFKVLLPLAALAILATLFLLSRGVDLVSLPFSEQEIAERLGGQQVNEPVFSGVTPKGDEVLLRAARLRGGGRDEPATASDLAGRFIMADGGEISFSSRSGHFDLEAERAEFSGDVRITTSTGYSLVTERLETGLKTVEAEAPGTVSGSGPPGRLTAGSMTIGAREPGGPVHLLFKDGVRMIYDPKLAED
ncbi:hypothetical protein [Pontibaca methylaminivorans]|uniref:hypothetical protein n=1 Tax=Pontibaca methylaminivorans TaxID=515897 RepID=UPI002FD8B120